MKELNDIIKACDRAVLQGKQTALAAVVKVEGSLYRRPGAGMPDIDAETSEEIALSIIAEIKAVFSKRQGSLLRDRATEIHNRTLISPNE